MNIGHFFPTAIASFKNEELAKQMLPLAKQYLADPKLVTNQWGYKNTYTTGTGIANFKEIQPYVDFITAKGKEYLENIGYDSKKINFSVQVFVSEMVEGDVHKLHSHPNSLLSGLLYLQVPEGSSCIAFEDPRPFRNFIYMPKKGEMGTNWDRVYFEPEEGLILMWESWIQHEVLKNESKEGRITMVFNLGWEK
jgi:uncharacterized protein (TIGR02466 family)